MSNKPPNERAMFNAARDVVERARAHDQVAMAILAQVRDNAKKGEPRAKASLRIIQKYIKSHPAQNFGVCDVTHCESLNTLWKLPSMPPDVAALAVINEAPKVTFWQAIVSIVQGPPGDALIVAVNEKMPEGVERDSFRRGVDWKKGMPAGAKGPAWSLGRIFGIGRAIQRLADETIPIAAFCPVTAWELGE